MGRIVFSPCCLTWGQTMVEVMKIMVTSFLHALLDSVPRSLQQATANPCLHWRLLDTHGQVWVSLFGVTAPFSWVLVHTRFFFLCVCAFQESVSPVLCKFWWLCGGANGDLLQEGLYTDIFKIWCLIHFY